MENLAFGIGVMGSQPISIQLRKILREIVVGKSCEKLLREILAGNCCKKILQEIVAGKSLQEILVGNGGGEKSQFKKDSDWWKFSILE